MKKDLIAGIDLGTSAVKVLVTDGEQTVARARCSYKENGPDGWIRAIVSAFKQLEGLPVTAMGLSSQVGTYIFDDKEVLSWQEPAAKKELDEVRAGFDEETFIREISMPHPELISYPMPRIRWRLKGGKAESRDSGGREEQGQCPENKMADRFKSICQPKEILCRFLTGKNVSDPYSWRGLANQHSGQYSSRMLDWLGIGEEMLPELRSPFEKAGELTKEAAEMLGLKVGIPVYTGCNDYYASLLGMGITEPGQIFDVTGTSEHVGVISENLKTGTRMISSPYFSGNVFYGVTSSSGSSLDFGIRRFHLENLNYEEYRGKSDMPVFLPYLKGERAPVFNENARGVFFGIGRDTTEKDLAYAIMEGVAFSTYDIWDHLCGDSGRCGNVCIRTSGGAARNPFFNQLKADLFGIPVQVSAEEDTSAYGACMAAAVGEGRYQTIKEAASAMCRYLPAVQPKENPGLRPRFDLYRSIYKSLINEFETFRRIRQ